MVWFGSIFIFSCIAYLTNTKSNCHALKSKVGRLRKEIYNPECS